MTTDKESIHPSTPIHPSAPRILAIEDNPGDVAWLRHALDLRGEPYVLEVLRDGESALAYVEEHRTGKRSPDPCVILLDLYLPQYDGIEILKAIKREPHLRHIHVVVLSSHPAPRDEATVVALGAACRVKPSNLKDCIAIVADILALCKGELPLVLTSAAG